MADTRPWITCHVLETTSGKPAANMHVSLTLMSPSTSTNSAVFEALTNSDGRVAHWDLANESASMGLNDVVEQAKKNLKDGEELLWSLNFKTGAFYGVGKTFYPEVELRFATNPAEKHYHVPLLLGPWSYTTYRGS